jgi:PmbA protein
MIKETYRFDVNETSFNLVLSRLNSIRKKTITRTGYRVYHNGQIAVHGQLGQVNEDPWSRAEENLAYGVEYPYEPAKNMNKKRIVPSDLDETRIMSDLESVLAQARKEHPDFIISNKINISDTTVTLENNQNTALVHQDRTLQVGLILKHKTSANIMDAFLGYQSRQWDPDYFLSKLDQVADAFNTSVDLPEGDVYVVLTADELVGKLISELNGEKVGYKSSLLTQDFGKKVFNEQFSFYLDWDEEEQYNNPFFDAEGTVSQSGRVDLIRNGVVEKAYTDKRTANRFSLPLTGSASSPYDGVPTLGARNFNIDRSNGTLKELLNGRPGLVVAFASGGDYTDDGRYASPVQLGFLTDGEKWLGRVPEFNISGNLYDLFGKDYIGYSKDRFLMGEHALVVHMNIKP